MIDNELALTFSRYRCKGVQQGGDILLRREDAGQFVADVARLNILIVGCDLWKPWSKDPNRFLEIVGGGDLVNYRLTPGDIQANARTLIDFISNEWPEDVARISFVFDDSQIWDLILRILQCD